MNFLLRWLRRKTKTRFTPSGEDGGVDTTNASIETTISGAGTRFPKLAETAGGSPEMLTKKKRETPPKTIKALPAKPAKQSPKLPVNIWELEDEAATTSSLRRSSASPRRRPTRTNTRMSGFVSQDADVVPLFGDYEVEGDTAAKAGVVMFPTGWLIIKHGAGRGATFPLMQGVSQIGRSDDQAVSLDYGDMSISRVHHAAIGYDASTHQFHLGHGGKSNLVRLNGKPLLSTEPVVDGDEIQIGETTLLLKVLCTSEFNWSVVQSGGDGHDMAIA